MECTDDQKKISELEERLKNVTYEMDSKLEDKIDELNSEIETLKAALGARLHNVQPGDVFFIESQEVANGLNYPNLMSIAKHYGCNFIAGNGLSQVVKMSEVELEQLNLRRIEPTERATALQRLEQILVNVVKTRGTIEEPDDRRFLEHMASDLAALISLFKEFELRMTNKARDEYEAKKG
jgi:hypothetical protein